MKHLQQLSLIFVTAALSLQSIAETQSYLTLKSTTDNADGKDFYTATAFDFIGQSQLNLSMGKGQSPSADTNNYSIGISSDPQADISVGLSYFFWEQENEIETRTAQFSATRNTANWSFSVTPQLGTITIYSQTAPAFDSSRTGMGLSAAYYGAYPLYMSGAAQFYSYEHNLSALNTNQYPRSGMRNFSMSTRDQATGLEDTRFTFDLGYDFSKLTLGYYRENSKSAVDNSTYTSNSIYAEYNLTDNWQLGAEAGRSKDSLSSGQTVTFTSISVTYFW